MRLCLVRPGVSIQDYRRDVQHRRHKHIAKEDGQVLLRRGFATWLDQRRGVLVLVRACRFSLRGASTRYGEMLAAAILRKERWALIVRSEMYRRKEGRW
jgi:hypothetical protein